MSNEHNRKNAQDGKKGAGNPPSGKTQQKNERENLAKAKDTGETALRTTTQIRADEQAAKAARGDGGEEKRPPQKTHGPVTPSGRAGNR